MPEIRPFRAWRYAGEHRDLTALIAPPYDVIGPEAEIGLRDRDPHNVVRLILPHDLPGQPGSRYDAARQELEHWAATGTLAQDAAPGFYPYRQTYRHHGRREHARVGFLGLLRLQPFGGEVMAHERTLAGPREDRFRLISATRANLSPVFVLFEDAGGEVTRLLAGAMNEPLLSRADREQGERDELWRLASGEDCRAVVAAVARQPLVFADGHHRYESALRNLETIQARGEDPGTAACILAFFAPVPQPGLSILPTHRIVHDLPAAPVSALRGGLAQHFDVRAAGRWEKEADVRRWEEASRLAGGRTLAMALRGDPALYEVTLRPGAEAAAMPGVEAALRELDVTVLHEGILKARLGIREEDLAGQTCVRYSHEALGALQELYGDAQVVFLLRPTPIESVFRVASAGLRMPQKSTFFYPKLATGFLIHRHE